MSYENPVSIYPELIHGSNYKPDTIGQRIVPLVLTKTGGKKCDLMLKKKAYKDLHLIEFLNVCMVVMWNPNLSMQIFCNNLMEGGEWSMTLTEMESKNVEKLLKLMAEFDSRRKNNTDKSGGMGFG